jgi:hypothetical protein
MSAQGEQVLAARLRRTVPLPDGRVRQFFDIPACAGMEVICESNAGDGGELEPISQIYRLANGALYDDADTAFQAWADLRTDHELLDAIGGVLLRHHHGLLRPLWEERTPEQKSVWIARARNFVELAKAIGLTIERRQTQ